MKYCTNCNAPIDDDATYCGKCGAKQDQQPHNLQADNKDSSEELSNPEELKTELEKAEDTTYSSPKRRSRKGLIAIIIVVVVVIAVVATAVGVGAHSKAVEEARSKEVEEYSESFSSVTTNIFTSAADAESAGDLIKNVWYNCIHKESSAKTDPYTKKFGVFRFYDDFNDALYNLFTDPDFEESISTLQDTQSDIKLQVKGMQNPPDEYSDAYDALLDYYDAYNSLVNLVLDPYGINYETYSSNFNDAVSAVTNAYNMMELYLDYGLSDAVDGTGV